MSNGTYEEIHEETPQGEPLSPLLSNIMLNEFDKELEARGLFFVLYAYDMLIFAKSAKASDELGQPLHCRETRAKSEYGEKSSE